MKPNPKSKIQNPNPAAVGQNLNARVSRWLKGPGMKALVLVLLLSPSATALAGLQAIAGHYVGAWTNLTFSTPSSPDTGKAVINILISGTNASLVFNMDGPVFGQGDPPPITMPGTVQGETIQIDNKGVGIFGDIKGVVNGATGTLAVTLTNIPGGSIMVVTNSGTVTNGIMHIDYTVTFTGSPSPTNPAHGVMDAVLIPPISIVQAKRQGTNLALQWTGGLGPFTVQTSTNLATGGWTNVGLPTASSSATVPILPAGNAFYRVAGQ